MSDENIGSGQNNRKPTLFRAIAKGHVETVKLLLQQGASATNRDEVTGLTPLALAAANGWKRLVKALLQREDVIANWMFEAWKEDVRREAGGEKFASNTPRAVAFRNGHINLANMLARSWAALEPRLDFSNLSFCKGIVEEEHEEFDSKGHRRATVDFHSDDEKGGRYRDQGTQENKNKNSTPAAFPLLLFMDDSKKKMRTEESHGNLGVRPTILSRKARSVSI